MSAATTENLAIEEAFLVSLSEGVIEFSRDWRANRLPRVSLAGKLDGFLNLHPLPAFEYAAESRYFIDEAERVNFVFDPAEYPVIDYEEQRLFLAGSFNGWQKAVGDDRWRLRRQTLGGRQVYVARFPAADELWDEPCHFKFVTGRHHWLTVDAEAPNAEEDGAGNLNYRFDRQVSGRHRFGFILERPVSLDEDNYLIFRAGSKSEQQIYLHPGEFFLGMRTDKRLGAIAREGETDFRLFAPRAKWVKLGYFQDLDRPKEIQWVLMERSKDGVWEATIPQNLHGWFYWYRLDGPNSDFSLFDPNFRVLDPYAKAAVGREGPGIVIDETVYAQERRPAFAAPQWQDLVVLEGHVRDLTARLPENLEKNGVVGFAELTEYATSPRFYPALLGCNALELQPVQENDSPSREDYHWGYMTCNYFAPASSYASDPRQASQIREFRELVDALHRRGMAVILDVVYNHVGEPAHLMHIDKLYYFHLGADGHLTNWSGCGNDLRTEAPMAKRLIIESLKHLVTFYGVDGFRFDLADLVGKRVLVEIERELKSIRRDIILIAEPWSFRGHIGMELRDTGYASWNDGYREFVRKLVRGEGNPEGLSYYLQGSPEYYARWPAQTVNYVESHDDQVWIDIITEWPEHDGSSPTINDIRRTHLMISLMAMSVGIPMFHSGMDFLRSKGGLNNTYQRGDVNALDYRRLLQYRSTHEYAAAWIAFRRSELGWPLRLFDRPGPGYFERLLPIEPAGAAMAMLWNADLERGKDRLLYGINPTTEEVGIPLGAWADCRWGQLADHDRFWGKQPPLLTNELEDELYLPPLSCGLWMSRS